jgi:signal peptidase I
MLIPKGMMLITGVESPAMVVISGSMEPALRKGDMLFVHNMSNEPVREGEIVLFRVPGLEHPIVHRVIKVTTNHNQMNLFFCGYNQMNLTLIIVCLSRGHTLFGSSKFTCTIYNIFFEIIHCRFASAVVPEKFGSSPKGTTMQWMTGLSTQRGSFGFGRRTL